MYLRFNLIFNYIGFIGKVILPFFILQNTYAYQDPAHLKEWTNLLHLNGGTPEIDSKSFFISQSKTPKDELEASIKALQSSEVYGKLKLPFACAYPARAKFIYKHFKHIPKVTRCDSLESWLKGLNPETLSIVFSSYYPNNPASIFGHTFLKINSNYENKISDYAINYLAVTAESNGLLFGIKGLLGFYRGEFSIIPYFLKINEYNNFESRDLYEYQLTLSKDEIDTLLRHLWEIENNGYFDYYFLDDNCSYFILTLLDVANPKLNLAKKFNWDVVIPAETIKAIYNKNIVKKIDYRPSLYSQIKFEKKNSLSHVDELDLEIKLKKFQKQAQKKWSSEDDKEYFKLLNKRSEITERSSEFKISPSSYPHEIHSSKLISMGAGLYNSYPYTNFTLGPGVHDFLDSPLGQLPFSRMNLVQATVRLDHHKKFNLESFKLIEVLTLNPHESWNAKFSWKAKIDFQNYDQNYCKSCTTINAMTGIGKSIEVKSNQLISFFINTQLSQSSFFKRGWTFSPNTEVNYHIQYKYFRSESSISLINRTDTSSIVQDLSLLEALAFDINQTQNIKLRINYLSDINSNLKDRSTYNLSWYYFF